MCYCFIDTPLGTLRGVEEEGALTALHYVGQKHYLETLEEAIEAPEREFLAALRTWLDDYFARRKPALTFPLAPRGTAFQQEVWKLLLEIPYGETDSYGNLAKRLAASRAERGLPGRMSPQAVGGAVGHNPISIIIPCHRVLGSDGSLTGYASGLDRKYALLKLEGMPEGDRSPNLT